MNKPMNFKSAPATNTASLTDVLTRCFDNAERILLAPDAPPPCPPAKPISLDYPHISAQPEYKAEADKLARFQVQRDEAEKRLEGLGAKSAMRFKEIERTEEDVIAKAESLLAGEVEQSLQAEIDETARLVRVLNDAINVQHGVVRRVNQDLSRAAGRRYSQDHKELVKRLMAAVVELHAANQAVQALPYDLVRLGYAGEALPAMLLHRVEDHTDIHGNITHYWFKEATQYVKSPEEIAAGVRKARLAAALS